ncbi:hypothetical protein ENKNEFLB_01561 [Nocardioides aquaticus]|uniref:DUF2357 domain-containing protein n=1 Tax=Nocardioides aquaticus TaxID=160826 RepID=A0ABX8EH38_9ACTN|nr:hypothetical protein [Nocardioides aquaticus]QVT79180.1 hypothetical protein ENKNEFLB_01561 [Nocardioides aquaticus]
MNETRDRVTGRSTAPESGWTGRWLDDLGYVLDPQADRDRAASDDLDALADHIPDLRDLRSIESWDLFAIAADPKARNTDDLLLEEREEKLAEHLPSIARICQKPLTRLTDEVDLLPVPRVRRPAKRAIERFTARTEDWAGRTLLGPVPRRALALLRVEDANLYENRMVNELVHPILSTSLARRIRQLKRARYGLAELDDATTQGTHLRQRRLYEFWGGTGDDPGTLARGAAETLAELERLAAAVKALRSTRLVRLLGNRRTGRRQLRQTNVIADNDKYHAAGIVWRAFERDTPTPETPDERRHRLLERHECFALYALVLIVRALNDLGYRPDADQAPTPGTWTRLSGAATWADAELYRGGDGTVTLRCEGQETRFVPLLDLIGPGDRPEQVLVRWASIEAAVRTPTVIVNLAPFRLAAGLPGAAAMSLTSAGADGQTGRYLATAVPVTPLESTSLERVARAVADAVRTPALDAYPPRVVDGDSGLPRKIISSLVESQIASAPLADLFFRADQDTLCVRRRMVPAEAERLRTWVGSRLRSGRGTGWERDFTDLLERTPDLIAAAGEVADRLMVCPACGQRADIVAMGRGRVGNLLFVTCDSCGARWGHHRCGACQGRIPFMAPTRHAPRRAPEGPGWVERTYGQDALASPCWRDGEVESDYVCPHCGSCGGSIKSPSRECSRCAPGHH